MRRGLSFIFLISCLCCYSQAVFTLGTYAQNFGTTAYGAGAFANNSTILGWYLDSPANFLGTQTITAGAPGNAGGTYMYICTAGTDIKLGTRPSNGSGAGPCDGTPTTCGHGFGVRLTNNLGATIQSLKVNFDAYQFSLAQNGGSNNPLLFYYRIGAAGSQTNAVSTVTGGTSVPALIFTAPQSTTTSGGSQIQGYPCNQTAFMTACFSLSVPAGDEIMLAWWDPNNSNNDPHMGIDNLAVSAYSDNACVDILPMELISFTANKNEDGSANLNWITASEKNNSFFTIERSQNGFDFEILGTVKGAGNSHSNNQYLLNDPNPYKISYYRLKQTDYSGNFSYSQIVVLASHPHESNAIKIMPNPSESGEFLIEIDNKFTQGSKYQIFDFTGKLVKDELLTDQRTNINLNSFEKGVYMVHFSIQGNSFSRKIIYH